MKLVPKDWDEYNPVLVMMGLGFMCAGGYALSFMGVKGPLIVWLLRGIPAIFSAMGLIILIRQFQLWRRQRADKTRSSQTSLRGG